MEMAKCMRCQAQQLREYGFIDYWYCENRCETGIAVHAEECGSDWDMMDKQSTAYKEATLNGD